MFKHILGQTIFQIIIMIILVFDGENFLPEYFDANNVGPVWIQKLKLNPTNPEFVRSGRFKEITSSADDYGEANAKKFPSRHFTIVFNTFVWLQIVNFINCRKLFDEKNVFDGLMKNPMFVTIVSIIIFLQIMLITFSGKAFYCYEIYGNFSGGLTVEQWLICIGFSLLSLPVSLLLKFIPAERCLQLGNKEIDPINSFSKIMTIRRINREQSMSQRISSLGQKKGSSANFKNQPSNGSKNEQKFP